MEMSSVLNYWKNSLTDIILQKCLGEKISIKSCRTPFVDIFL